MVFSGLQRNFKLKCKFFIRIDKYENIIGKTIDNEKKSCYYECNNFITETR